MFYAIYNQHFPTYGKLWKMVPPTPRYGKFQTKNAVIYSLHVFMLFITSIYRVLFNFEGGGGVLKYERTTRDSTRIKCKLCLFLP